MMTRKKGRMKEEMRETEKPEKKMKLGEGGRKKKKITGSGIVGTGRVKCYTSVSCTKRKC